MGKPSEIIAGIALPGDSRIAHREIRCFFGEHSMKRLHLGEPVGSDA